MYNRKLRVLVVFGILAVAICVFDALQISATTCASVGPDYFKCRFAACVMVLTLFQVHQMVNWRNGIRSFGTETPLKYTRLVVSEIFMIADSSQHVCAGSAALSLNSHCIYSLLPFVFFLLENIDLFSAPFLLPIEAILVSRLLLDLHGATAQDIGPMTSYHLSFAEIGRDRQRGEIVGVHVVQNVLTNEDTFELQSVSKKCFMDTSISRVAHPDLTAILTP
ncbi:hypothetical protein K439DRAFT_1615334 [Ramaria rubella]|nr:hypothetical protein K439DRAFT_1615334 [Ramaria rubella]